MRSRMRTPGWKLDSVAMKAHSELMRSTSIAEVTATASALRPMRRPKV